MRVIKFRGKRVNSGEWVESMTISNGIIKRKAYKVFFEISPNKWVGVIPETVGQFTGLLDKNGKEIYEGDVVVWTDSDSIKRQDVVKWASGGLCLCNSQYTVGSYVGLEVIGNEFDNPELLKGGEE